jgi:hypothetical protein
MERNETEDSLRRAKREFKWKRVLGTLENRDTKIASAARTLYGRTIERGAHPNRMGALADLQILPEESGAQFRVRMLSTRDIVIRACVKNGARVGLCALLVFRHVFPERFECQGLTQEALLALSDEVENADADRSEGDPEIDFHFR